MAKNPNIQLTDNGVLILYNQSNKQIFSMQVIFLARTDTNWYIRLSDGKCASPIVRLQKKSSSDSFSVGAVLSIKEVVIFSQDLDAPHALEDPQVSRVLIKDYIVLESHTSFTSILGRLNPDYTYREAVSYISPSLIKIDPKLEKYFRQETKRYERLKEDGERLRERGNALFKKKSFDQAIIHYDMAKQKDPFDFRVWSNSSQAHFNGGEFKKAEDEALMAIKLNPFSEKAYHRAGKAALKQSGKDAAVYYARSGMLICDDDRDLQKLLEECADESSSAPDTSPVTAFYTDEGMEKLMRIANDLKAKDKNSASKESTDDSSANIPETDSSAPDDCIKEVLSDKDIISKCSWERLKSKADVVPSADDDNQTPTTVEASGSMDDVGEENDSDVTYSRSRAKATFSLRIPNCSKLTTSKYSQPCFVRNLEWRIMITPKFNAEKIKQLGFFLRCCEDKESTSWSCNANADLRLLSVVKGQKPFIRKIDHKFSFEEIDWGFTSYMKWEDVMNPEKGFIKNDTITVDVHMEAEPPQGVSNEPRKPSSSKEYSNYQMEDDLDSEDEDKKSAEVLRKKERKLAAIEDRARKEEARRTAQEQKKIMEERRKAEAELEEQLRIIPKDPYHQIIYEGRKFYEQGQYRQALDFFGKPVPEFFNRNMNAIKLKLESVVVQFLSGICKIQSGKGYILEGMDIMNTLTDANATFPSAPAAHYWLGIGFERIFILKLAHHHGLLCSDSLRTSSKYRGINWPGSEDFIQETLPDKLAILAKELVGRAASTRPTPKARCRFKNCIATQNSPYAKEEIYISDPDFKGFLDIACEEYCSISYHPCCWKAYKEIQEDYLGKMTDKDFLDQNCKTPDCFGTICTINIYDETGNLKNSIQKDKVKKEIKGLSILAKQKKKKEKKEKRTAKNDSKKKNKLENQNEANKENRDDKENVKEEGPSKKDSIGQPEEHKARTFLPTQRNQSQSPAPFIQKKEKAPTTPILPIDPESLATEQVTILVSSKEDEEFIVHSNANKKNKKKKKNKQSNDTTNQQQTELLGDPMQAEETQRNEYLVRLRLLKQQREYYEDPRQMNVNGVNNKVPHLSQSRYKQVLQWLDPEKPFYLPQHLRDNPEELERVLQTKMTTTTGPDVSQDTIITLLSFMYDWLKELGPMSINDARIREYVMENFPPEGKNHINQCGSIKEFLMQSIDFALIDDVICVRDHVVQAQEMTLKSLHERMMSSRYLISDGKKARKLVHLLEVEEFKQPEDVRSTCSSASSSSHIIGSTNSCTGSDAASSVSKSTNHSVAVEARKLSTPEARKLSTPVLELNNAPSPANGIKKFSSGGMGGLDDFEMPEMTGGNKEENQIIGAQDAALVSSGIGVHRDLDDLMNHSAVLVSETLPTNSLQQTQLNSLEFLQARTPYDSPMTPDVGAPPTFISVASVQENEEVFNSEEEDEEEEEEEEELSEENHYVASLEALVSSLRNDLHQQESQCQVLSVQNEEISDKFHQHKTRANLDLGRLKKQCEELNDKLKSAESERSTVSAARESEAKKFNSERTRMQEEVKNLQGRNASLELQHDRANDRIHELEQKLADEMVVRGQLREEMKNLQESLTSSSRRAHEAEVKYLGTKKDLTEQHLKRTMDRLSKEVARMRQLLVHANDNTVPDRSTLSQSIIAWDAHIANLQEVIKAFVEQGVKFLGMVNQGRPLNALPAGDLQVPPIQDINVADLLCLGQKAQANLTVSGLPASLSLGVIASVDGSASPGSPASIPKAVALGSHYLGAPVAMLDMNPVYARNGPAANAFNNAPSLINDAASSKTTTAHTGNWPDANQLFVGQLPWNYNEDDVQKFFTEQFGEVVSVRIYDKGTNPDGRPVPKYGFVVFRHSEDRDKALNKKPIMINNHAINVQAKEPMKTRSRQSAGPPPGLAPPSHIRLPASSLIETAIASNPSPPAPIPAPIHTPIPVPVQTLSAPVASKPLIAPVASNIVAPAMKVDTTSPAAAAANISGGGVYGLSDISVTANNLILKNSGVTRSVAAATPTQSSSTTPTSTKPKFQNLTTSNISTVSAPPPKLVRPLPNRPGGGLTTTAGRGTRSGVSSAEDSGISGGSAYKKLIEVCKQRLGTEYAHPEIYAALREVRQRNNNTLSGLSLDVIVDRVRIQLRSRRPGSGAASVAPWAGLTQGSASKGTVEKEWRGDAELAPEDQCSICLEALATGPTVALQCKHVFHEKCIKDWLKRQSNCPNCRKFALMTDEYPSLS